MLSIGWSSDPSEYPKDRHMIFHTFGPLEVTLWGGGQHNLKTGLKMVNSQAPDGIFEVCKD